MPDLGKKHECVSCSTRFYDLGRTKLICPRCGADQNEPLEERKGAKTGSGKSPAKKPKKRKAKK